MDKKIDLQQKAADRDKTTSNWLELAENFFETAFHAREIMESKDVNAKRGLIRSVGWNLFLRDKKLEFSFKKPFDVLLRPEMRNNVQGLSDYVRSYYSSSNYIYASSNEVYQNISRPKFF